jgi:hypothetical protein
MFIFSVLKDVGIPYSKETTKDSVYASKIRVPKRDRSVVNRRHSAPPRNARDPMVSTVTALRELYRNRACRDQIVDILESKPVTVKPETGRPGMDLWTVFVLAQLRLSKRLSYGELHPQANDNKLLRQVMGIEMEESFGKEEIPCQTIYDNVFLIDDETVKAIDEVTVSFGHGEVFKKKRRNLCVSKPTVLW